MHCHENIISFLKDLRLYMYAWSQMCCLPYYGINKGNRQIRKVDSKHILSNINDYFTSKMELLYCCIVHVIVGDVDI